MNPILGLDLGRARIGAAISDELQLLAHPLETIPANELAASRIAEIVQEKKIDHVVTGMPRQMNGQLGAAATEVIQKASSGKGALATLLTNQEFANDLRALVSNLRAQQRHLRDKIRWYRSLSAESG